MEAHRIIAIAMPCTGEEEWQALRAPLESGWLTQGPKVAEFEQAFAARHDVRHALATTSCTTALHLSLLALEIGPGDEVIVPAFTWVATANAALYCGATPVFADVDRNTYNIDPEDLARRVTSRTKAVIVVHLFGLCADMDAIRTVVPEHIAIVEDAACAAGARYGDRCAGALGEIAAFSFHPRKSITTGEGGMVTTDSESMAKRVDMMRNHGASIPEEVRHRGPKPYLLPEFDILGFNYRMTDLQAAVGVVQLGKLDRFIAERQQWAEYYCSALAGVDWLRMPVMPKYGQHAWQAFVTHVDPERAPRSRNEIMEILQAKGIATRPGTHAVHALTYYRERFGLRPEDYPVAHNCQNQSLAIPLHNRMTREDYDYVVDALRQI